MAIQSRSEQLNGKKGGAYAEEAAKLGVTTKYTSDEHLKMLSVMSKSMEVDDPKRLANAIQYMSNNLVDFKDEFVDSVVEYTVQTSKFLDTPEKLATLVGEIGKLGVWSDDKALVALKESSLKFTNQDDVTRPSTAVYSYRQNYRGTVTNPGSDTRTYTYYYRYAVTIEYADNFNPTLPLFTNRQPNAYGKCNVEHSENRIRHRQGKRSYSKVPS